MTLKKLNKLFLLITLFCLLSNLSFSQFDASYDLRTYSLVTPVKDQGLTCGSCWAFASCAAIESSWLKQSLGTFDLSEDNLLDCHNFDPNPCDWGNFYMTNAILSSHKGLYTEAQDPYTTTLQDCPCNLSFPPEPIAYIEEVRFIPGTNNDIKQAILDYGAVASSMFFNGIPANWDGTNYKYYDSTIGSEDEPYAHCVTIVGWDDNLTFSGAPGNGGWIIKDSYGTSWADNGYFYCSYYDDGILSSNVVFPTKVDIPAATNTAHTYYHDEFGWVNNYGFSNEIAYGLTKYTIMPSGGNFSAQQIKRIGTYAVTENSTIDIEIYRTKTGNVLSDLIATTSITCPEVGFYTAPISLGTDTLTSDIYIKVKYTCESGTTLPIPIEENEAFSSSAFAASSNSCWISSDANNWTQVGQGTAFNFDLCIKMYTEDAPYAKMNDLLESACHMDNLILESGTTMPFDFLKWYANDMFIAEGPSVMWMCDQTGTVELKLVAISGANSDSVSETILINELPEQPAITLSGLDLVSSSAFSYQWLFEDMNEIPGENQQTYSPPWEYATYFVKTGNEYACFSISESYVYIIESINTNKSLDAEMYPSPAFNVLNIKISDEKYSDNTLITIYNSLGELVSKTKTNTQTNEIDVQNLNSGVYTIRITNSSNESITKRFIKE